VDSEIVIPIFPTVYAPNMVDKVYSDALLESDIEEGDKVLVVGAGSGTDAWLAWLKSQALVYVVEINPMAVVNARTTARMGGFKIKPIVGDITKVELPDVFNEFDFVLWNMPFLMEGPGTQIDTRDFHDGDGGRILREFLALLPSLLNEDGTAILLNSTSAADLITAPGVTMKTEGGYTVFTIPNDPRKQR
jgi:methylase of polypeptide subunit release factors